MMKKMLLFSAGMLMLFSLQLKAQTTVVLIDPNGDGGFETADSFEGNGWGVQNATYGSRKWQIGTGQPGYDGERCAFIGSSSTTVGTNAGSRTVHLYRPITVPEGATNIQLSFKYKQEVVQIDPETGPNDYLYLSILDDAPATGNTATSSQFGEHYPTTGPLADFTQITVPVPAEVAGAGEKYLVITFRSNNLNDPDTVGWGAIDDISLTYDEPCNVAAPTASAQEFCNAGTVAGLTAEMSGSGSVVWYDAAEGGTALSGDTALATGTYYAAVVDGTCESERTSVAVTVNVVGAPQGEASQDITADTAADATLEDIAVTADGTVVWYASEADAMAGNNPLPANTQLESGATYYATQTVGDCTSANALAVTVNVMLGTADFAIKGFSYYPNPVNDVLNLSAQQEISSVAITNLLGQQVIHKNINAVSGTVNTAALPKGTYLVTVTAGAKADTFKMVK